MMCALLYHYCVMHTTNLMENVLHVLLDTSSKTMSASILLSGLIQDAHFTLILTVPSANLDTTLTASTVIKLTVSASNLITTRMYAQSVTIPQFKALIVSDVQYDLLF